MVIKSMRMRWIWRVEQKGKLRNAYRILVRRPEWKTLLGKT
jgi:hypothetical protein